MPQVDLYTYDGFGNPSVLPPGIELQTFIMPTGNNSVLLGEGPENWVTAVRNSSVVSDVEGAMPSGGFEIGYSTSDMVQCPFPAAVLKTLPDIPHPVCAHDAP